MFKVNTCLSQTLLHFNHWCDITIVSGIKVYISLQTFRFF